MLDAVLVLALAPRRRLGLPLGDGHVLAPGLAHVGELAPLGGVGEGLGRRQYLGQAFKELLLQLLVVAGGNQLLPLDRGVLEGLSEARGSLVEGRLLLGLLRLAHALRILVSGKLLLLPRDKRLCVGDGTPVHVERVGLGPSHGAAVLLAHLLEHRARLGDDRAILLDALRRAGPAFWDIDKLARHSLAHVLRRLVGQTQLLLPRRRLICGLPGLVAVRKGGALLVALGGERHARFDRHGAVGLKLTHALGGALLPLGTASGEGGGAAAGHGALATARLEHGGRAAAERHAERHGRGEALGLGPRLHLGLVGTALLERLGAGGRRRWRWRPSVNVRLDRVRALLQELDDVRAHRVIGADGRDGVVLARHGGVVVAAKHGERIADERDAASKEEGVGLCLRHRGHHPLERVVRVVVGKVHEHAAAGGVRLADRAAKLGAVDEDVDAAAWKAVAKRVCEGTGLHEHPPEEPRRGVVVAGDREHVGVLAPDLAHAQVGDGVVP